MASREAKAASAKAKAANRRNAKRPPARHDDDPVRVYPNGRVLFWDAGVKGKGTRREKRCGDLATAEVFAANLRKDFELMNGVLPGPFTTTDQAFQSMLVNLRETNADEGTIDQYKSNWLVWVPDEVGTTLCKDLSLAHWTAIFDNALINDASKPTITNVARTVNAFTSWAIEHDYVMISEPFGPKVKRGNIVTRARKKAREPSGKHHDGVILLNHCPTDDQVERYAHAVEKWYPGYGYRLVMLAWGTGMRIGELLALRHDTIDVTTGTVTVDWQLNRKKPWPALKPPKGGKPRKTILWSDMNDIAESLIEDSLALPEDDPHHGWLFPRHRSTKAWATMCGRLCGWAADEADWAWRFHWLRHAYATTSLAPRDAGGLGLATESVSAWLGHSRHSITTDMYVLRQQGDNAHARAVTAQRPVRPARAA